MSQLNGKLVVVLGGDWSGKSTFFEYLSVSQPDWIISTWFTWAQKLALERGVSITEDDDLGIVIPSFCKTKQYQVDFMLQVFRNWVNLEIKPSLKQGKTVVVDSYLYRFIAKEEYCFGTSNIRRLSNQFGLIPHHVFLIENNPELAWSRKRNPQPQLFETGARSGQFGDFFIFQTNVYANILQLLRTLGIKPTILEGLAHLEKANKLAAWESILLQTMQASKTNVVLKV